MVTPSLPGVRRSPAISPSRTPRPTPTAYAPTLSGSPTLLTTCVIALICKIAPVAPSNTAPRRRPRAAMTTRHCHIPTSVRTRMAMSSGLTN